MLNNFPNPCDKTETDQTNEPYFCYKEPTFVSTLMIPLAQVEVGGYRGTDWEGYEWYLNSLSYQETVGSWGTVIATTGKWDKNSYGWFPRAINWTKRITFLKGQMSTGQPALIVNFDTSTAPLGEPTPLPLYPNPPCHQLSLCVYRPNLKDPCGYISLCRDKTSMNVSMNEGMNVNDVGGLEWGPHTTAQKGIKIIKRTFSTDEWFQVFTGISGQTNNWLLMAEQAANYTKQNCAVCMGPRPVLKIAPAPFNFTCFKYVMTTTSVQSNCSEWDKAYPLIKAAKNKPLFSSNVAKNNFTCVNMTGTGNKLGTLTDDWCSTTLTEKGKFTPVSRADIWWWCGDNRIFDKLPANVTGLCAVVSLLLPVTVFSFEYKDLASIPSDHQINQILRQKREIHSWQSDKDPTYIDAIGVPRGVPDEYKLADQVAGGFESFICWWCTINKNVDRINYVHYNVQRLGNWTQSGFEAVHGQLAATSLMAFQNRIALDMLLAEKHGVCSLFGQECCTFIPNNTASDGSLTLALEGLRTLNGKMKEHSGVDTSLWDSWMEAFGKYRSLVSSVLVSIAVFAAILTLCGCCCIPCIRGLVQHLITTALAPPPMDQAQLHPLLSFDIDDAEFECEDDALDTLALRAMFPHE